MIVRTQLGSISLVGGYCWASQSQPLQQPSRPVPDLPFWQGWRRPARSSGSATAGSAPGRTDQG